MFSDEITTSDAFLDMPMESQLLYFHLGMNADDDGFIANTKMTQRIIGAGDDALKLLFVKKFLVAFENGVCVIKHWRINNYIRKDIYRETKYIEQKRRLYIRENGAYSLRADNAVPLPAGHFTLKDKFGKDPENEPVDDTYTPRARNGDVGKDSIGKDRLDKDSTEQTVKTQPVEKKKLEKDSYGEMEKVKLTPEEYQKLVDRIGEKNTQILIFELDTYIASKGAKYQSHYATLLNWAKRKAMDQLQKAKVEQTNKKRIV